MAHSIQAILSPINGVQFATVMYNTKPLALGKTKLKNEFGMEPHEVESMCNRFIKRQEYSVIVAGKLKPGTSMYANQVKRTVEGVEPEEFKFAESKYQRTACNLGSIVALKTDPTKVYLHVLENSCKSSVIIDTVTHKEVTKAFVAQYMTAKAAEKLLNPPTEQYSVANDATHTSKPRFYPVGQLAGITANGKTYSGKFVE